MTVFLAFLLVTQQQPLRVTAEVDRGEIEFGTELVLTVTVRAEGNEPVQILNPPLSGMEIRSSSERSDVSVEGGVFARVTTREIRLAPTRTGTVTIGPVRAVQGENTAESNVIEVLVEASTEEIEASMEPHLRAFIERQPPPRMSNAEVLVQLLSTADTITLGDQVDLIVLAWFPREIRSRLRTPPTLQPPQLRGAWVYEQGSPGVVALSRQVRGIEYDVYAHHTVVFPLTPGAFAIGPATVSYSLPLSYSFLSREIRHEPQSQPIEIYVRRQPMAGRPANFGGTAAADLKFTIRANPTQLSRGGAGSVVATLAGRGNVSLWPEPEISWPDGIRVYPENVDIEIAPQDGMIAGIKRFHYLVVADSFGTHRISISEYPYYDLDASRYVRLSLEAVDLVTEGGSAPTMVSAARSLDLAQPTRRFGPARLVHVVPLSAWLLITLLPPLIPFVMWSLRRHRRKARSARQAESDFQRVESDFNSALNALVPDAATRDGCSLSNALRAVGVEQPVAAHVVRVRDRLWQAGYGPGGKIDPEELVAEMTEVLHALGGGAATPVREVMVAGLLALVWLSGMGGGLRAQTPERLYETGAFRAAADSFRARAETEPWSAVDQENLGVSLYRLGDLAGARAAWIRAARLAPRSREVRDLLQLDQAPGVERDGLLWISPVTPAEALLLGIACWIVGWFVLAEWRRIGVVLLVTSLGILAYAGWVHRHYTREVGLVVAEGTPLRWAPYGPAPARRSLDRSTAVRVDRRDGRWLLVTQGHQQGWIMVEEIEPL